MFRTFKIGAAFTVIALLLTGVVACSGEPVPKLIIHDPWARPAGVGGNAVVYFTITNKGRMSDALVDVSSDAADTVGIHETRIDGNMVRMATVSRIEVPAGGSVELEPGGFHIMMMGLKRDLNPGEMIKVTLRFDKSVEITVTVEVRKS